jgi:hypothetical protein
MPIASDMAQTKCPWCKNKFHSECIEKWLVIRSDCPLCRRDMIEKITDSFTSTESPRVTSTAPLTRDGGQPVP